MAQPTNATPVMSEKMVRRFAFYHRSNETLLAIINGGLTHAFQELFNSLVLIQDLMDAFRRECTRVAAEDLPTMSADDAGAFDHLNAVIAPEFHVLVENLSQRLIPDMLSALKTQCVAPLASIYYASTEISHLEKGQMERYRATLADQKNLAPPIRNRFQVEKHNQHTPLEMQMLNIILRSEYDTTRVMSSLTGSLSTFCANLNQPFKVPDSTVGVGSSKKDDVRGALQRLFRSNKIENPNPTNNQSAAVHIPESTYNLMVDHLLLLPPNPKIRTVQPERETFPRNCPALLRVQTPASSAAR